MTNIILKKSQIIERKLRFEGKPISFKDYPLSRQIIDTKSSIKMLIGGRQISKSFTLMGDDMSDVMGKPFRKLLYVAPKIQQSKAYSDEKINDRIKESPDLLKWYMDKNCVNNVFLKTFRNGSKIYFRSETQVNSIRGLSVHKVKYDEIQDMSYDNVVIIDETMSGRKDTEKWYAGTPLTIQNLIHTLWSSSKRITPIMVCPAGHHQPPGLYNIHKDGVRCHKCKERINVRNTYFQRMGDPNSEITAFWVPQIVLPLHAEDPEKWRKLWVKFLTYPPDKFKNEVMGISAGEGVYLVTEEHIQNCCKNNDGSGSFEPWSEIRPFDEHGIREMWAGVDWGITQSISFTVLIIGGWDSYANRFRIIYAKKFLETDPIKVNREIARIIQNFGVEQIVADWGAGHVANRLLEIDTGLPVQRTMYTGDRLSVIWDNTAGYYKASRTLTLINTFNQIKEGRFWFPTWEWTKMFAPHILAEYFEARTDNAGNNLLKFDHPPDQPDDFLQALNILYNVWAFNRAPHRIFR